MPHRLVRQVYLYPLSVSILMTGPCSELLFNFLACCSIADTNPAVSLLATPLASMDIQTTGNDQAHPVCVQA